MPYIGGVGLYRRICEEIVTEGYKGFRFRAKSRAAAAERSKHTRGGQSDPRDRSKAKSGPFGFFRQLAPRSLAS